MTIDEAIQDFDEILDLKTPLKDKDYTPSLRIGREAMKAIKRARRDQYYTPLYHLAGETEE